MVQYRVRAQSLGEVSTLLDTVVATFDSNLAEASATVSNVAGSTWQGEDADKFVELWGEWESGALLVRQALTGLASQLRMAESSYITTEVGLSGGFGNRRQSTTAVANGASSFAQRVAASQSASERREEAEADVEAQPVGYGQFVTGGAIASKSTAEKGEKKSPEAESDESDESEASDV